MDLIDLKILNVLEMNARVSLKDLARDLNIKTSTIYNRLHKLKEARILEKFTICVNPNELGLNLHVLLTIRLKKMILGKIDLMFLESFAKYLSDQFEEIQFCSVGSDEQIWLIATFQNEEQTNAFQKKLKENTFIDSSSEISFSKIIKGTKIFSLIPKFINITKKGNLFDETKEILISNKNFDEKTDMTLKNTQEVVF